MLSVYSISADMHACAGKDCTDEGAIAVEGTAERKSTDHSFNSLFYCWIAAKQKTFTAPVFPSVDLPLWPYVIKSQ